MDIRRFGIGHRRSEGPAGSHGVEGLAIHADGRGVLAELAFRPHAAIVPHSNPNLTYFVVIEGGGFVRVGGDSSRVAAGEAVVWPPNVVHAAWTEETPMRAMVVEFPAGPDEPHLLDARAANAAALSERPADEGPVTRLHPDVPPPRSPRDQEPW